MASPYIIILMVNKVSRGEGAPIKTKISKKRLIVGISIVVIIVAVCAVVFFLMKGQKQEPQVDVTPTATQSPLITAEIAAATAGDTEKGYEIYDEAINKASDDIVVPLYVKKAAYAFDNDDLDSALIAAQEAVTKSNDESNQAYSVLGRVYAAKGEYQKSLESFQKALEIFNAKENYSNTSSRAYYERKIDEVKAKI